MEQSAVRDLPPSQGCEHPVTSQLLWCPWVHKMQRKSCPSGVVRCPTPGSSSSSCGQCLSQHRRRCCRLPTVWPPRRLGSAARALCLVPQPCRCTLRPDCRPGEPWLSLSAYARPACRNSVTCATGLLTPHTAVHRTDVTWNLSSVLQPRFLLVTDLGLGLGLASLPVPLRADYILLHLWAPTITCPARTGRPLSGAPPCHVPEQTQAPSPGACVSWTLGGRCGAPRRGWAADGLVCVSLQPVFVAIGWDVWPVCVLGTQHSA